MGDPEFWRPETNRKVIKVKIEVGGGQNRGTWLGVGTEGGGQRGQSTGGGVLEEVGEGPRGIEGEWSIVLVVWG